MGIEPTREVMKKVIQTAGGKGTYHNPAFYHSLVSPC
jgi:hypothetical protein